MPSQVSENSVSHPNEVLDALIVGAGFSGVNLLLKLRKDDFNVKVYEAGGGMGGVWYWNCYPGARCDSDSQIYQLSEEELWKDFKWSERFASHHEVKRYFQHIDDKLNLSKDIQFNTRVTKATFDSDQNQWFVQAENGTSTRAKHLILCIGFAARSYTPDIEGLDSFKGEWYHSSAWPQHDVDLTGKKVAVIGTGATGVQIIQEIGPVVDHLTVYQRTPNIALPMVQYSSEKDALSWQLPGLTQKEVFEYLRTTFGGVNFNFKTESCLDVTPEERNACYYERLYKFGGFAFWMGTYADVYFNKSANDTAYEFWCKKTRARISNPVKKDILAPLLPNAPHGFGLKRPSLEQRYFEVMDQDNVDIIDINKSPIIRVAEKGLETQKEGVNEVDVIIFATGFDSITGSMLNIDIVNGKGETLEEKWRKNGVSTFLGMTTVGYPNMYFLYGPQAPTAFSNGPTSADVQGEWIRDLLVYLRKENISTIEASKEAEETWSKCVTDAWNASLFPQAKSWYQGNNIPGKRIQPLNYIAGFPTYINTLVEVASKNYEGFVLGKAK